MFRTGRDSFSPLNFTKSSKTVVICFFACRVLQRFAAIQARPTNPLVTFSMAYEKHFYHSLALPFITSQSPLPDSFPAGIPKSGNRHKAPLGQFFTHSMHKIHSVPFSRFLELSVTSTFIGHTRLHLPHEIHFSLSHFTRNRE